MCTGYGGSVPEPFAFTIGAGEVIKGFVDSAPAQTYSRILLSNRAFYQDGNLVF